MHPARYAFAIHGLFLLSAHLYERKKEVKVSMTRERYHSFPPLKYRYENERARSFCRAVMFPQAERIKKNSNDLINNFKNIYVPVHIKNPVLDVTVKIKQQIQVLESQS